MMDRFNFKSTRTLINASILLVISLLFCGCKTVVRITSDPPGGNVYDGDKLIGVTPLEVNVADLKEAKAGGRVVSLEKQGYHRVLIWLPDWIKNLEVSLNMNPFLVKASDKNQSNTSSASRQIVYAVTARLFKLQNAILSEQDSTKEISDEVDKMLADNPGLGSLQFLKAVVLARQNKEVEARRLLESAMQVAPREYDFLSMYNILGGSTTKPKNADSGANSGSSNQ
jgi:hypothetical protein